MFNIFVFLFFYKVSLVTIHKYSQTGCKESQFYSLPFGQAVASMYQPESRFNQAEKNLMSRTDYRSSVIRLAKKISLARRAS